MIATVSEPFEDTRPLQLSPDAIDAAPSDDRSYESVSEDSPWSEDSDSESPASDPLTTNYKSTDRADSEDDSSELAQTFCMIELLVVCLYRMPIRTSGLTERLTRKLSGKVSPYEQFDVLYVKDLFPRMDTFAATNLGRLVTLRRQALLYKDALESSESDRETPTPSKIAPSQKPFTLPLSATTFEDKMTTHSGLYPHHIL